MRYPIVSHAALCTFLDIEESVAAGIAAESGGKSIDANGKSHLGRQSSRQQPPSQRGSQTSALKNQVATKSMNGRSMPRKERARSPQRNLKRPLKKSNSDRTMDRDRLVLSANKAILHEVVHERRRHKSEISKINSSIAHARRNTDSVSMQAQELESQVKMYSDRCIVAKRYAEDYRKQLKDTEDEMFKYKKSFLKSEAALELEQQKNAQLQLYVDKIHTDFTKLEADMKSQQAQARKQCKDLKAAAVKIEALSEKRGLEAKHAKEELSKLTKVADEMRSSSAKSAPRNSGGGDKKSLVLQKALAQERLKIETLESKLKKGRELSVVKIKKEKSVIERTYEERLEKKLAEARDFYRQKLEKVEEKMKTDMDRMLQKRMENLESRSQQVQCVVVLYIMLLCAVVLCVVGLCVQRGGWHCGMLSWSTPYILYSPIKHFIFVFFDPKKALRKESAAVRREERRLASADALPRPPVRCDRSTQEKLEEEYTRSAQLEQDHMAEIEKLKSTYEIKVHGLQEKNRSQARATAAAAASTEISKYVMKSPISYDIFNPVVFCVVFLGICVCVDIGMASTCATKRSIMKYMCDNILL
jgi:hypothetical protein